MIRYGTPNIETFSDVMRRKLRERFDAIAQDVRAEYEKRIAAEFAGVCTEIRELIEIQVREFVDRDGRRIEIVLVAPEPAPVRGEEGE